MAVPVEAGSPFAPPLSRTRRLLGRIRSSIGLDVGGSIIKVAEVAWEDGVPRLLDYAAIPVARGSALHADQARVAADLEHLFASRAWETSRVVAGLSGGVAFFRNLKLPNLPEKDLLEAARWEGQSQLPYPADEVIADYQPLGLDAEGKAGVLLAGAPRRAVEQTLELAQRSGIELAAIEVDSLAVYRCLDWNGVMDSSPAAWTLVCDLGHEDTTLTAFRGGVPQLVRGIRFSIRSLAEAVATGLGTDDEEAFGLLRREGIAPGASAAGQGEELLALLATEVQRSCEYLFYQDRSVTSASVFLSGGGAVVGGLGRVLEMRVNDGLRTAGLAGEVEVRVAEPLASLALDKRLHPFRRQVGPNFACAVGLALRGER